jgi:hypothetical protein
VIARIPDDWAKTNVLSLVLGFESIMLIAIKAMDIATNKATKSAQDLKHWP